jgi:hypothetical protein
MTESASNEGARPTIELSEAEEDMILMIREWGGDDDCRLLLKRRDGAWRIALSMSPHDVDHKARGTGATFDQAWDNMDPTWAWSHSDPYPERFLRIGARPEVVNEVKRWLEAMMAIVRDNAIPADVRKELAEIDQAERSALDQLAATVKNRSQG